MKTLMIAGTVLVQMMVPVHGREISAADLRDLPDAKIVVLGEVHDNPIHHKTQAEAVAAIRPKALVFEMLTPEQATRAIPGGSEDALSQAFQWEGSGWPSFSMYYPIFAAAPDAVIFGAGVERETLRRVRAEGVDAVFGPDAGRFGLDHPLAAADQAAREGEQQRAHCNALPPEALPGMVLGQRVRDAALARAALDALERTGGPVVVIAGSGHARRDVGAPALIALADPAAKVLSIGQIETGAEEDPAQPYDLWLSAPPTPREDVCAAFRK